MKLANILLACLGMLLLTSCSATAQSAMAQNFEYRGIYSPTNALGEVRLRYATNHVDYDWDLWGHNLKKVVEASSVSLNGASASQNAASATPQKRGGGNADIYATVADTLCTKQFCFTSDKLYRIIESYILDQYGEGTDTYHARICIMPQDNKLACTCGRCRKMGNSDGNATPAVTDMLCRLAKRFPRHLLFTSAYHSTRIPPKTTLPSNVGVLISAIDLPYRVDFTRTDKYKEFVGKVEQWKKVCTKLYVWDYERNYEDYLTPFPCLTTMQKRLQLYRDLGIQGIFINGSGDEFSSFDDMQTVVLAQMLADPDIDIDTKVAEYYREAYPMTHKLITDYYLKLEHRTAETNHVLPLYATMEELVESYLNAEEFTEWRKQLDKASKATSKPERTRLNYLLTALAYTQLQLMQMQGNANRDDIEEMCEILRGHSELKGMEYYSESYGKIDDYIKRVAP